MTWSQRHCLLTSSVWKYWHCGKIVEELVSTLLWRRSLSYRNQSIDSLCKSMDWFLYNRLICKPSFWDYQSCYRTFLKGSFKQLGTWFAVLYNICGDRLHKVVSLIIVNWIWLTIRAQQKLYLTHFIPKFHYYTSWKIQKARCFLRFSGSIEIE